MIMIKEHSITQTVKNQTKSQTLQQNEIKSHKNICIKITIKLHQKITQHHHHNSQIQPHFESSRRSHSGTKRNSTS